MQERNPYLQAAILEVVENQIRDLDPPETKQTFDRLVSEGTSEDEARRLIGCVVAAEIFHIMERREEFNRARYVKALSQLPKLPWDE